MSKNNRPPKGTGTITPSAPSDDDQGGPAAPAPNPGVEDGPAWEPPSDAPGKVLALPTGDAPKKAGDEGWTVKEISEGLQLVTFGADAVAGRNVGANLAMSDSEADTIAVPLTRIINRRPALRRMKGEGGDVADVIRIARASMPYGMRVAGEAIETKRQRQEEAAELVELDGQPA